LDGELANVTRVGFEHEIPVFELSKTVPATFAVHYNWLPCYYWY